MKQIDRNTFFDITQTFDFVPFTQSKGFWAMNTIEEDDRFLFFSDSIEKPTITCMAHVKKFAWLKMLQIDGECLRSTEIDSKKIREFYKGISQMDFDMIEVNSSLPYSALYEIGIRQAGFLRPAGLFSTPQSITVDLQKPIEYNQNWQICLKKSVKNNLFFVPVQDITSKDVEDYCAINEEMTARKQVEIDIPFKMLKPMLNDKHFQLSFVENEQQKRIAGSIIYKWKNDVMLIYAATAPEGREKSAAFFMYDNLFKFLTENGYHTYDFGRISPSTHAKNNVFLFKNGVKGNYVLYCGEFSCYKRWIYRPLMYFVKKYLFKKVEV